MKIQQLSHGLFMFRDRLYMKYKHGPRESSLVQGIFAIALRLRDEKIEVMRIIESENYFKGDVQCVAIGFDVLENNVKENKEATFFRRPEYWEFRDIEANICYVPYGRDEKQEIVFRDQKDLCLVWNSKKLLPKDDGKPFYAIDLTNSCLTMQEPIWAHWMGQLRTWPVRKVTNMKITIKEEVKIKEAI